jgi:hypothetical protein
VQRCPTTISGGEGGGLFGIAGDCFGDAALEGVLQAEIVLGGVASMSAGSQEASVFARAIHGKPAGFETFG